MMNIYSPDKVVKYEPSKEEFKPKEIRNTYIKSMKDTLVTYKSKIIECNKAIADNNSRYLTDVADAENKKVSAKKSLAYNEAVNRIEEIFKTVRECLACSTNMNADNLTSDMKFYEPNSPIKLSRQQVLGDIERYRFNPTMLAVIQSMLDRYNSVGTDNPYVGIKIPTAEERVRVYKQFAESALGLVEQIKDEQRTILEGNSFLDAWGQESFGHELYDIIGSGVNLSDYNTNKVSDHVRHSFDNIVLAPTGTDANHYMPTR